MQINSLVIAYPPTECLSVSLRSSYLLKKLASCYLIEVPELLDPNRTLFFLIRTFDEASKVLATSEFFVVRMPLLSLCCFISSSWNRLSMAQTSCFRRHLIDRLLVLKAMNIWNKRRYISFDALADKRKRYCEFNFYALIW